MSRAVSHSGAGGILVAARRHPLAAFFALAFALSWLGWAPLVAHAVGLLATRPSPYWHLLGSLGPLLGGCIMGGVVDGVAGVRDLLRRVAQWRTGVGWWLAALLAPLLLYAFATMILRLVTGGWPAFAQFGRSREYPALPLLAYWLANVVFYGFGEEVGWRGFALPRLQHGRSALAATALFSLLWAAWHVPLFTFAGGLAQLGLTGAIGWYFSLLTGAILLTWLYNSTEGSLLLVAVFHGTIDIVFNSPVAPELANVLGALVTIWGIAVLALAGPRHLARGRRKQEQPPATPRAARVDQQRPEPRRGSGRRHRDR